MANGRNRTIAVSHTCAVALCEHFLTPIYTDRRMWPPHLRCGCVSLAHGVATMHALIGAVLLSTCSLGRIVAQEPPAPADTSHRLALRLGDVLEVRTLDSSSSAGSLRELRCTGTVTALRIDTISVRQSGDCAPRHVDRAEIQSLRRRYDAGSRSKHTGYGLLIGTASGAVVGRVIGPKCVLSGPCDSGVITLGLMGGAVLGALTGTVVGALRDAGNQWLDITIPRVVRLTGLAIQPSVRISSGNRFR